MHHCNDTGLRCAPLIGNLESLDLYLCFVNVQNIQKMHPNIFIDHEAREIIRLVVSVCVCVFVCLSIFHTFFELKPQGSCHTLVTS